MCVTIAKYRIETGARHLNNWRTCVNFILTGKI